MIRRVIELNRNSVLVFSLIAAFLILNVAVTDLAEASPNSFLATIKVEPQTITALQGDTFSVNINVYNALDLFSFQFYLRWKGSVLNVTDVTEGDFLNHGGVRETFFQSKTYNEPDIKGVSDYTSVWGAILGPVIGETGSGTLATVTFLVEEPGETPFDICKTELRDSMFPSTPPINHAAEDGYFSVKPPMFHVYPERVANMSLTYGETFAVNVSISDVENLYGFAFNMSYDTAILNATNVALVPFLNEPTSVSKGIDNETRIVWVNVTSTAAAPVSGNGTVATITFQVVTNGTGESVLDIYVTRLDDKLARLKTPPFEHSPPASDGYFSNMPLEHDIAITRVVPEFPIEVTAGESVVINVTIRNKGDFAETFNVTIYYDGNTIQTWINVTLDAGNKTTLSHTWDTTNVEAGEYYIKAEATVLEGETSTDDNQKTAAGTVKIKASESNIILYVAAAAAIIVVAVVIVYFVKFRK